VDDKDGDARPPSQLCMRKSIHPNPWTMHHICTHCPTLTAMSQIHRSGLDEFGLQISTISGYDLHCDSNNAAWLWSSHIGCSHEARQLSSSPSGTLVVRRYDLLHPYCTLATHHMQHKLLLGITVFVLTLANWTMLIPLRRRRTRSMI